MKLHLGCGKITIPGYVNVDIQTYAGVDVVADLSKLPFRDGCAGLIYSCAAIEHFGRREWQAVLAHWYSKLKPGGLLRLSTADSEAAFKRYGTTGNLQELLGLLIGGQKDDYDWHGMLFDYALLEAGLREIGFEQIHRYDWRDTEIAALGIDDYSQAYLPHMDKDHGTLMMLNVEATRPR
ncbi:MAG: methyltransferase domain-containing protein [Rhodobacteraceae bacterium]|nr:methyltransferase domain-containing protein [Paracoccaceae bacterium]